MRTRIETMERQRAQAEIVDLGNRSPVPRSPIPLNLLTVSDRWLEFMGYTDRSEAVGRTIRGFTTPDSV